MFCIELDHFYIWARHDGLTPFIQITSLMITYSSSLGYNVPIIKMTTQLLLFFSSWQKKADVFMCDMLEKLHISMAGSSVLFFFKNVVFFLLIKWKMPRASD